jgi:hypothetical protein
MEHDAAAVGVERRLVLEALVGLVAHLEDDERLRLVEKPQREPEGGKLAFEVEAVNVVHITTTTSRRSAEKWRQMPSASFCGSACHFWRSSMRAFCASGAETFFLISS